MEIQKTRNCYEWRVEVCDVCGEEFLVKVALGSRTKLCSKECREKHIKNRQEDHMKDYHQRTKINRKIKKGVPGKMVLECDLCGKPFEIIYRASLQVYPRYCGEHRNEWKRELYNKQKNN